VLRPHRFEREIDPGPVQIQARKVAFDVSDVPLHWIPGHPVASNIIGLLNIVLPAAERWFVATYNEALPLVQDPRLAEDMRGFIGQEATHADTHEKILNDFMIARGLDPAPAAIEHYTAVLGDFALNCAWDDHGADPTLVDLFRWHGSEEVEHRNVAHEVAVYFHDSYFDRIRSMGLAVTMIAGFFQRGGCYLCRTDPELDIGWWRMQMLRARDSKLGLLPKYRKLFGGTTLTYFRPGYSPEEVGSTAQAVAYLASSPAARAAHL